MIDYDADALMIDEILELAEQPEGAAQTAAIEQLLARADDDNLVHSAIFTRTLLAVALLKANIDDLGPTLGLFAESKKLMQEHEGELLSEVVGVILVQTHMLMILLMENPDMPLDRIQAVLDNYEQMARQSGISLRGAYALARAIADRRGDYDAADHYFVQSQSQPRDWMVINDTVENVMESYVERGLDEEALRLFENATPEDEGHYFRSVQMGAMIPAWRTGRTELAARLYEESQDPEELDNSDAPRLSYLALAGRFDDGLALLPAITAPTEYDTVRTLAWVAEHAVVLLARLQAAGRGDESVDGMSATVSELLARYRAVAEDAARRFDKANKTDTATRRLTTLWSTLAVGR